MNANRPRLYLAESYDPRAQTGVVVVELRGNSSRYWENVQQPPSPATLVNFGLAAARGERLRDFDLFLTARVRPLRAEIGQELGEPRIRWVARRKNLRARKHAHAWGRQHGRASSTAAARYAPVPNMPICTELPAEVPLILFSEPRLGEQAKAGSGALSVRSLGSQLCRGSLQLWVSDDQA